MPSAIRATDSPRPGSTRPPSARSCCSPPSPSLPGSGWGRPASTGSAIPLGLWLGQGGIEKALLVGSILLILIVELLNSAIEAVVDRVSAERHELSKRAKDIGSAAVLVTLMLAGAVWALILIPHYL